MAQVKLPFSRIIQDLLENFFSIKKKKIVDLALKVAKQLDNSTMVANGYDIALAEDGYEVIILVPKKIQLEIKIPNFSLFTLLLDFNTKEEKAGEFSFYITKNKKNKYFEFKDLSLALRFNNEILTPIDGSSFSEISYGGRLRISPNLSISLLNPYGLSFTPSEIANTGLVVGFKGLRLDASPEKIIEPLEDMGFDKSFKGVYFEEVQLQAKKGKWFKGFPELKTEFLHAAFGSTGVTFKLKQFFPIVIEENRIADTSFLVGQLLFKDWKFGLDTVHLGVRENKILKFGFSGFINLSLFDNLLLRTEFSASDFEAEKYTVHYKIAKMGDTPTSILKQNLFFNLIIGQLELSGQVEENRNYLDGHFTGTIKLSNLDLAIQNAHATLLKTEDEEVLTILLEAFAFEGFELVDDATFFWKKYKVVDKKEGGTETEEWLEESYIELKQNFGNLKEKLKLDKLPENFPILSNDYELYLKYFWSDIKRDLHFQVSIDNVDYLWSFIPENFRPKVQTASFNYHEIAEKKEGAFSISDKNFNLSTTFSLTPLFKNLPLKDYIHIQTGNEEGWIKALLKKSLVEESEVTGQSSLIIEDAMSIDIDIPGLDYEEPPLTSKIESIRLNIGGESDNKFELGGLISFKPFTTVKKSSNLSASLEITDLPFKIGSSNKKNSKDNELYFMIGGVNVKEIKKLFNFKLLPKAIDEFVANVFKGNEITFDANPVLETEKEISDEEGNDGKGFKKIVKIHKKLGPITLQEAHFIIPELKELAKKGEFIFDCRINVSGEFGPFFTTVNQLGIGISLKKGQGVKDLDIGFKPLPPNEAGFNINLSGVSGGGVIKHFPEDYSYSGNLNLNLQAIDLIATAIITTRLPNNKPGFSMLVSISVLFNPAIQLSFGFTLVGVGGLIGVNRTMKVDALRERLATGAINSIMFPEDPIENADRIISDLMAVFPPKEKHFIIAPFLRIGYGTPSIIELDLGVLIEFPFKGRIILLGSLGIYLPAKNAPLAEIHIDVMGDFNFAAKYIRVDGRLRDSHIVGIPLTGGFAFLLDWGDRPAFLFSIGGYHPRYKKPARFREIPRLAAVIKKGDELVISCEYYQAITSNTFQIGFAANLAASFQGARVEGYFGFNVLLMFDPFYFEADIGFSVSVKYKGKLLAGIDLYFGLMGPAPWIASGYAKIKLFKWIEFTVDFRITWGKKKHEPKVLVPAEGLLLKTKESLAASQNWTTRLPADFITSEYLRPSEEILSEGLVMHPNGFLEVRQTVLPFNHPIQKFGHADVPKNPVFTIQDAVEIGANEIGEESFSPLMEMFARGQFQEIASAQKLSTKDFELFEAGRSFGKGDAGSFDLGTEAEHANSADVVQKEFEDIVITPTGVELEATTAKKRLSHSVNPLSQLQLIKKNSRCRHQHNMPAHKYKVIDNSPPMAEEPTYMIIQNTDLNPVINRAFTTYDAAETFLNKDVELSQRKSELKIRLTETLAFA